MLHQELVLSCEGCSHVEGCKANLKACELYYNAIEGIKGGVPSVVPSYHYFDKCEDGYSDLATVYSKEPRQKWWDLASQIYESSVGEHLDFGFKDDIQSWHWLWAYKGNKLVGAVGYEHDSEHSQYYINFLYVRKHHQRQGVGEGLLDSAINPFHYACAYIDDDSSRPFYEKMGYVSMGRAMVRYPRD